MPWKRNKSPHNAEELMIAEYQRQVEIIADLSDELEMYRERNRKQENTIQELYTLMDEQENHHKDVIKGINGVVDLKRPITLYKVVLWSSWNFKNYFDFTDFTTYGSTEKDVLTGLLNLSNDMLANKLLKWADEHNHSEMLELKHHTFKYTLSVPKLYDEKLTVAYDPSYSTTNFVAINTKPETDTWLKIDKTELRKYGAKRISEVFRDYAKDRLRKIDEEANAES